MADETDLLNDALGQVGAASIMSIDDGSINANYCLRFYPPLRDALLRSHHWNFALKWQQLAQDVTAPVAGFAYAYTLPPECLKVVDYAAAAPTAGTLTLIYENNIRVLHNYQIEGRKLVSNDGTVYIQYIQRLTNPDLWDGLFYQTVTTWLASKLAMAIPKDARMSQALLIQARDVLMPMALAVDGQEGATQRHVTDDLLWGR